MQITISQKFGTLKNPIFPVPSSMLSSASVPVEEMWVKPLRILHKIIRELLTVFAFEPILVS